MSKRLEDMTYDELVDYASAQIFDGLLTGGGKEFKTKVHIWLGQAITWDRDKRKKKNG
jgi:hypothetical protein